MIDVFKLCSYLVCSFKLLFDILLIPFFSVKRDQLEQVDCSSSLLLVTSRYDSFTHVWTVPKSMLSVALAHDELGVGPANACDLYKK